MFIFNKYLIIRSLLITCTIIIILVGCSGGGNDEISGWIIPENISGIGGQLLEMETNDQILTGCKNIDLKFQKIIARNVQALILIF